MTWDTEESTYDVILNGEVVYSSEGELTAEEIKRAANAEGMKKFEVETTSGADLEPENAPFEQDVVLTEYNENK